MQPVTEVTMTNMGSVQTVRWRKEDTRTEEGEEEEELLLLNSLVLTE